MLGMLGSHIFNAKVIDNKAEHDGFPLAMPQPWCSHCLVVVGGIEACGEEVFCQPASLGMLQHRAKQHDGFSNYQKMSDVTHWGVMPGRMTDMDTSLFSYSSQLYAPETNPLRRCCAIHLNRGASLGCA